MNSFPLRILGRARKEDIWTRDQWKAGKPIVDLVPHHAMGVTFGGLKGEVAYTDDAFGVDRDIQERFYGDAAC